MNAERVIVVGGGVIGLGLAWELSRRGVAVTLLDRGAFGQATSWAAAGILPPANQHTATDPLDRLRGVSHDLFPPWCRQLNKITGIDCGLRRCGGWYLAETAGERAAMIGMTQFWKETQIECTPVDLSQLEIDEPLLSHWCRSPGDKSAWWLPDEYQIRTPRFLNALAEACHRAGVKMREEAVVRQVRSAGTISGVLVDDRWIDADAVVLCGGAWTGLIDDDLQLRNSIVPVRGQILLLKTETTRLKTVINVGHRYLIGRDDGHVLVGSCEEEVGYREGTTVEMLDSLRGFAESLCPELTTAVVAKAWSGFRPMTFDAFPMIGKLPGYDGVYVAAGHYRSGVHLAPATAVTLADILLDQTPAVDVKPFRVGKQIS